MSPRLLVCALFLLLASVACTADSSAGPSENPPGAPTEEARVEPEQVAERLLTQLRDEDYGAAYETLSTGQARDIAANQVDLMTRLMGADTLVREWSLDEPTFISVDEQSKVEVTGSTTFDDGGTGRIRIVMQAVGMQADPWRVDGFELTRDRASLGASGATTSPLVPRRTGPARTPPGRG